MVNAGPAQQKGLGSTSNEDVSPNMRIKDADAIPPGIGISMLMSRTGSAFFTILFTAVVTSYPVHGATNTALISPQTLWSRTCLPRKRMGITHPNWVGTANPSSNIFKYYKHRWRIVAIIQP